MNEEWKQIIGCEGRYDVSSLGRVKNIVKGNILKNKDSIGGYKCVRLCNNNKIEKTIKVHRLVAQAFIPNPENKPQVNHIDSNRSNNNVSNLEWCTPKENIQHAVKMGRTATGEKSALSKLKEEDVLEILQSNLSDRSIAKKYGVVGSTVSSIKRGITWKHLKLSVRKKIVMQGEGIWQSKLTEDDVREIRKSNLSDIKLGKIYNVGRLQIYNIKRKIQWKHIK